MRISTIQMNNRGTQAILDRQASATKTQLQLSTGKRMITPADDPSASAAVVSLNQSLASMSQFKRNSDFAMSRLQQEESALMTVDNILQRVRELTLQGTNASQTFETRASTADEVELLLEDLLGLANSKDASNSFLFAGYQDKTQPFTRNPDGSYSYLGDTGRRMMQISDTRQVASHDSGRDVFVDISTGNRTFEVAGNSSNQGTGVIDPGWVTNASLYDDDTYTILFPIDTEASNTLTFNDAIGTDDTLQYDLEINGTTVYSVDETATAINTLSGLADQINLSESTTGVRAYVDDGQLYLSAAPGTASIEVTETIVGATALDGDEITGYFGSVLNGDSNPSETISFDSEDAEHFIVVDSDNNIASSGMFEENSRISFAGVYTDIKGQPTNHDTFTISPSVSQDLFTTVQNLADAIRISGGSTAAERSHVQNIINRELTNLDRGMQNIDDVRASVGARLRTIDVQADVNEAFEISIMERRSELEDLDFVEAISRFNLERTALEAAQSTYVRMQGLSLFNLL